MALKEERVIARIPRDEDNELKVITGMFWNKRVIDIRWWNNGKPTKKGIRINEKEIEPLRSAVEMIRIGIEERNEN
jgi:hypothetical protein|tara:strand:+ start:213 stop:440 length:228 start_codon:yes stop_codon:yes gene_type:complete